MITIINNINNIIIMTTVNHRSTKAEILAHCETLQRQVENGPDWDQVAAKVIKTAGIAQKEFCALVRDTYNAGAATRRWVATVVAELSRPMLR